VPILSKNRRDMNEGLSWPSKSNITKIHCLESLPRKGFKTITVREGVFCRFVDMMKITKQRNPEMCNSSFLTVLLNLYEGVDNNLPLVDD
jgi:hypothetical protein